MIPLISNEEALGGITLNSTEKEIVWAKEIVNRASVIGEMIANTLLRKQQERKLRRSYEEINALNKRLEFENIYF